MRWVVVPITGVWILGRGINGLIVTSLSYCSARCCLPLSWREAGGGKETREIMGKRFGKELNAAGSTSVTEEFRQVMEDMVEKSQRRRIQSIQELKDEIMDRDGGVVGGSSGFGERASVEEKQKADEGKKAVVHGPSSSSMPKQGYIKKVDVASLSMPSQITDLQDLVVSLREFMRTYMSRVQTERERLIAETKGLNALLSKRDAYLASTQASYSTYITKALEVKNKAVAASVKSATIDASTATKQYQPSTSTAAAGVVSHPKYVVRTERVGWQNRWGPEEDQRAAASVSTEQSQPSTSTAATGVVSHPKYVVRTDRVGWQNRWGLEEEVRANNAGGQRPNLSQLSEPSTGKLDSIDLRSIVEALSELKQEVAALKR